jgi:hypothetical protein
LMTLHRPALRVAMVSIALAVTAVMVGIARAVRGSKLQQAAGGNSVLRPAGSPHTKEERDVGIVTWHR